MGRAAFRALAVCVVLLVPGPRTASPEAPRPSRTAASSVVLRPTPRPELPQVVEPPPFLVAHAPLAQRGAKTRIPVPAGTSRSEGTRARGAASSTAQTGRPPRSPASPRTATQYKVVEGDSLWSIARRFGTTVEALAAANGISEADFLQPGQVLRVPTGRREALGSRPVLTYTVRQGDTLWAIALKTGVRVEDLAAANGIQGDRLRIGQKLGIPTTTPAPALRPPQAVWRRQQVAYLWPARGLVTSRFGARWRRHHTGVDIAAPRGTPIHAARDGRVVRAGWYGGYGLVVVLDHGDGMETWYGHASAVLVRVGQEVRRGQVIGRVGCTGACTGPHVHFEVRVRGEPVNPLRYLP